jgi:hypothetical protein
LESELVDVSSPAPVVESPIIDAVEELSPSATEEKSASIPSSKASLIAALSFSSCLRMASSMSLPMALGSSKADDDPDSDEFGGVSWPISSLLFIMGLFVSSWIFLFVVGLINFYFEITKFISTKSDETLIR